MPLPLPNTCDWKAYFTIHDFQYAEFDKQIRRSVPYRMGYQSEQSAYQQLSPAVKAKPVDAIPYLVRLAGKRVAFFYRFHFVVVRPWTSLAVRLIKDIHDKSAIPRLKTIMFDPWVGASARQSLLSMDASFSIDELRKLTLLQVDFLEPKIAKQIIALPKTEAASILLGLLESPPKGKSRLTYSNPHWMDEKYVAFLGMIVDMLAGTGADNAFSALVQHIETLDAKKVQTSRTLASPDQMNWFSDAGRDSVRHSARVIDTLSPKMEIAVGQLIKSCNTHLAILGVMGPSTFRRGKQGQGWLNQWAVRFRVLSATESIVITISINGKPLTDSLGRLWLNHLVQLKRGQRVPYEAIFEPIWAPRNPSMIQTDALVEVSNLAGQKVSRKITCARLRQEM